MPIRWSVVGGLAGSALAAFATSYQVHPLAPWLAHVAAMAGAVGTYLIGLYTSKPGV